MSTGASSLTAGSRIERALGWYDAMIGGMVRVAEYATLVIAVFITGTTILAVFTRFALNSSLTWTEEVSSLLLSVMMFLVVGVGFHERLHIGVGMLMERLPLASQRVLDICIHLVCAAFFVIVAVGGWKIAQTGMGLTLATVEISRGVFFLAMPIGGAFTVLVCLNKALNVALGRETPRFGGIE
jgi:TRAP-type transport system small permease protein